MFNVIVNDEVYNIHIGMNCVKSEKSIVIYMLVVMGVGGVWGKS